MAEDRCDRCGGPIPNTRVTIILTAEGKAEIRATLCTLGCALEWLGMTREEVLRAGHQRSPGKN